MTTSKQQTYKGKILFLHGYTQNASLFYAKTSALRKKIIKLGYKCQYLNAPYVLTPSDLPTTDSLSKFGSSDQDDVTYRGWWVKLGKTNDGINMDDSIESLKRYIHQGEIIPDDENGEPSKEDEEDKKLPIVGLVGFSQGASFAGLVAEKFGELFDTTPLKFVILYSGFKLNTSKKSGNDKYDAYYESPSDSKLRYLHVYGELDTVVAEDRSLSLYNITKDKSDLLKHPGGHFVPNSKLYIDQVVNWIQSDGKPKELKQKEEKKVDDIDSLLEMMDNIGKA
ncbi:FSH3 [Candida margitis]|uniref:FSH3 n=1 Tax=Candida margitis TaxID=1775924 RepID=UPI0022262B2F|nr:FSH3 [Candida margitis]KAI5969022.1 FSH3 [Candida margitis]